MVKTTYKPFFLGGQGGSSLKGKKRTGIDLMRSRAMYIHTVRAYF